MVAVLTSVVGCTATSDPAGPAATATGSTSAAATTATASGSAAPTASAAPGALPADCNDLLSVTDLDAALGTGLPGSVSYVRGAPIPDIGRTDRITCGYGVVAGADGTPMPPQLEISLASYTDEAAAAARVDVTTAARQAAGDRVEATDVGGVPAVLLSGPAATTLVLADGTVTYALTLLSAVLPPERTPAGLAGVAEAVLV